MIDLNEVELYPIQFANLVRLWKNDAVYIFDEVGSGKTISSGLMALSYLSANPNDRVLVITTNSLSRYCSEFEMGQFKKDWMEKLPFRAMGKDGMVDVVNNHHSKFKEYQRYGFVIIDEAQMFLNKDTQRYKNLVSNIRASKIVFLTATPIKSAVSDLDTYTDIAEAVLGRNNLQRNWITDIETCNKNWEDVICSEFDVDKPVTRYFKDTIMALSVEGFQKTQAKRLEPCLWEYGDGTTKDSVLLGKIKERLSEKQDSRFVLFTRYVEKEADRLGVLFEKNGFKKFSDEHGCENTYYVVTGRNGNELSRFSGTDGLPTVLILTYQISEQGLNLPGFNHVVNYHISAYPSALEQRFGRIDRMGKKGSVFGEIFICYLIKTKEFDSSTVNFYQAVATYVYSMLSYLPSKNTLLSPEILEKFVREKVLAEEYTQRILNLCKDIGELDKVIEYYKNIYNAEHRSLSDESLFGLEYIEMPESASEEAGELLNFCIGRIDCDFDNKDIESVRKSLISDIRHECREMMAMFGKAGNCCEKEDFKKIIISMRDKIMYCKQKWSQQFDIDNIDYRNGVSYMDAISGCGGCIERSAEYKNYVLEFNNHIKIPVLFTKSRDELNRFYEDKFINNDFNSIFPDTSHKEMLLLNGFIFTGINNDDDRNLLLEHIDTLVKTLPFFEMCRKFKEYLLDAATTNEGYIRIRFDFDPFSYAIGRLSHSPLKVSRDFNAKYFDGYKAGTSYSSFFLHYFSIKKDNEVISASNWLKLVYQLLVFENETCDFDLFEHFIYTGSGKDRAWTTRINSYGENSMLVLYNKHKVWRNDRWTKAIQSSLHGITYE